MLETFEKILKIYGSYLKGERQERYVIEVLYYILSQNKKITDKFITANGQALGQIIHRELHNPERKHPTHSFTLEDSVTEQTFNTQRVLFRFSEIGRIINIFVQKKA